MEDNLPKRLFRAGTEPQVSQINNCCRMSLISKLKEFLPSEYNEVKRNPTFKHILGMYENSLGYSARLIHSSMCRQLITEKKYELWFVFGGKPLRFSLQEFYAVTGLKSIDDGNCDTEKWKDDFGFWSKLLKRKGKISIKKLMDEYVVGVNKWSHVDRIRLVYICLIAGFVMAKDEKKNIPHKYIKLVMDLDKLQTYPWGVESFNLLVKSIIKTRDHLKNTKSYVLDGFSFAFQIWIMEAILEIGKLLGKKINEELTEGPRCSNWKGAAKVSYEDIILVENSFGLSDVVYPYLNYNGNNESCESATFIWSDEMRDDKVVDLVSLIGTGYDFGDHVWGFVELDDNVLNSDEDKIKVENQSNEDEDAAPNHNEQIPISGVRRCKKKLPDHGAEKRKKDVLCKRACLNQGVIEEDIKVFIQKLFEASFSSFESKIDDRFERLENEVSKLKDYLAGTPKNEGPPNESQPTNTSAQTKSKDKRTDGVPSNAYVDDGTENFEKKIHDSIPTTLFNDTRKTDKRRRNVGDYPLVFVSEDDWENLRQWGLRHEELKIGPVILNNNLLDRVITPSRWLENKVSFEWEDFILAYGNGELPSHGRTNKRWATDLDRIYVPLNINQNHWISMCINFLQRTIEVFDCSGNNNKRNVEPFLILIPRIVKAIHQPADAKHLHVSPYSIRNVQVKHGLNKSSCCCGVYAIKYIECHVLGLDFALLDDENIQEARLKIAVDLWNAANDTMLIDRMSKYEPTQFDSNVVDID